MGFDITGLGSLFDFGSKVLDKVLPDPQAKAAALLELEKLKQEGHLAEMANDADLFKAEVEDRTSARTIHSRFVDWLAVFAITISVTILCGILFYGLAPGISDMTAGMIIGMFVGVIPQILNYYFGSSSSGRAKTDALVQAVSKQ